MNFIIALVREEEEHSPVITADHKVSDPPNHKVRGLSSRPNASETSETDLEQGLNR